MKTLILVRGVPGAGKTSLLNTLKFDICVSADDYHTDTNGNYNWKPENVKAAHEWCQSQVEDNMFAWDRAETIVVHNTFTQLWEMQPYFDLAEEYGYRVVTLIVENRHGSKSVHNVPEETIQKMKDRFEVVL